MHLSLPLRLRRPPRDLSPDERAILLSIADVLIPPTETIPAPSRLDDYVAWLDRALAARPRAFAVIVEAADELSGASAGELEAAIRALADRRPTEFHTLASALAGAYLMVPAVRSAIGYPGQERKHPRFDEAAEEIMDGILDPVLERGHFFTPAP